MLLVRVRLKRPPSPQATAARVAAFLGLRRLSRPARLPLRQGRDDLSDRVANWDDAFVRAARDKFAATRCRAASSRRAAPGAAPRRPGDPIAAANAMLRAHGSFEERLERRERELDDGKRLEALEAVRARERRATDATRLARRETADRERQTRADRLAARLGPEGRARLDMMLAARAAATAARALGRRRLLERDLDEERNVCIEGREVLMGMTRGVG